MRRILIATLLAAMALASCNNATAKKGNIVATGNQADTTVVELNKKYHAIEASACFNVVMSETVRALTIVAEPTVQQRLHIRVEEGELKLDFKRGTRLNGNVSVTAIVPYDAAIKEVELSGASTFTNERPIVGNYFSLDLSGASTATCRMDMPNGRLEADLSGNCTLEATGHVAYLEADLSGSSALKSKEVNGQHDFLADNAEVELSGSSTACLHSNGTLRGETSGVSQLTYTGKPKIRIETSGASKIIGK